MPYYNMQMAWFTSRMVFICHFLDSLMRWLNNFPQNEHDIPVTFLFQIMLVLCLCLCFGFGFTILWIYFKTLREFSLEMPTTSDNTVHTVTVLYQSSIIQYLILYHLHQTTTLLLVLLLALLVSSSPHLSSTISSSQDFLSSLQM